MIVGATVSPVSIEYAAGVLARYRSSGNMDPGTAVALILLGLLILVVIWYFSKPQRLKREIASAQKWRIAELPDSTLGRIVGVVKPVGEVLTSPLGGRRCIYYLAQVRTGGKHPKTVAQEERSVACTVEDDSGRALVDVAGAEMVVNQDAATTSGTFDNPTEIEAAFLAKHGQSGTGMVFNRALVYREWTIEVGETIAVLGAGVREPDPDAPPVDAYRGEPRMRLRLTSTPRWRLRISDHRDTMH